MSENKPSKSTISLDLGDFFSKKTSETYDFNKIYPLLESIFINGPQLTAKYNLDGQDFVMALLLGGLSGFLSNYNINKNMLMTACEFHIDAIIKSAKIAGHPIFALEHPEAILDIDTGFSSFSKTTRH